MLIVAVLGSAVFAGIVGTVIALDATMREHGVREDVLHSARPGLVSRLRERVLLRWDSTRRLM